MSSSLHNERYKMLLILSAVVILLSTIKTGNARTLVDLPLYIPIKSVNIHATLTDAHGTNKYFIQESISAFHATIKGKIVISGEKDNNTPTSYIYYNTDATFNKERLVIHGTNCLVFTYKNNWDQTLPGINKPVTNLVLLMGPSILYRLGDSSLVWKSVRDANIRGTMMKGATTEINKLLNITYYHKKHFDDYSGIRNPSRIEFSGYDPYSTVQSYQENLILDIYVQNEDYYDELATEVSPLPGIGCPHYLSAGLPSLPLLKTNYAHFTMVESIQGSTNSRTLNEIHASGNNNLLRLKSNVLGVKTEAIYDYQLGVYYLLQEGDSCKMAPTDLHSPGISSYRNFNLASLFLIDSLMNAFKYLGKYNLEHSSGFAVDAWESIRANVNINGKMVDRAVITQYFAESQDSEIFQHYTLVRTTIATYKLDSSKKTSTLEESITRDYMSFETGSKDEFHDIFTLKECKYLYSDKTLTLAFKLQREGINNPLQKLTESHVYELKQSFIYSTFLPKKISPLRIDNVQCNFNDEKIEIEVTFRDSPDFKYIFNSKTMFVSPDTFKQMQTIKADNEYECLDILSKNQDTISVVIYRYSDSVCGYLRINFGDLKEDMEIGESCSVYHFPLHNLHRVYQEIPLDQIHNTFLQDVGQSYHLLREYYAETYKVIDVIDKTKSQVASAGDFVSTIEAGAKLNSNHKVTVVLPNVKTFADCYLTCHDSEQLSCNTFSFCENGDCRVSSLLTEDSYNESHIEQDKTCYIYASTVFNDYSEVPHRKFKTQTSIADDKDVYYCAELCHASPDCFSFQYCGYGCNFGGVYTDANTEYDEECSIYIPKVYQKYQKTGNKIASDVFYTDMNLNFEQCASLCHGWSDGETGCKSFNYCPKSKTESSSSLIKFSVKSSNTKTSEGGDCSNYELKVGSNAKKSKESSSIEVTKGTSGSGAFGIIMLFSFVGALLGFAVPLGYSKVKQMRNAPEVNKSFNWTRQVDEQAENIN